LFGPTVARAFIFARLAREAGVARGRAEAKRLIPGRSGKSDRVKKGPKDRFDPWDQVGLVVLEWGDQNVPDPLVPNLEDPADVTPAESFRVEVPNLGRGLRETVEFVSLINPQSGGT
jgi:hypothetical protein